MKIILRIKVELKYVLSSILICLTNINKESIDNSRVTSSDDSSLG